VVPYTFSNGVCASPGTTLAAAEIACDQLDDCVGFDYTGGVAYFKKANTGLGAAANVVANVKEHKWRWWVVALIIIALVIVVVVVIGYVVKARAVASVYNSGYSSSSPMLLSV
jgi:hypothetical protein